MEIIISNEEKLEQIKKVIKEAGIDKFHLIADFDRTLARAYSEGKKVSTSYAQLRNNNFLGRDYELAARTLFIKYNRVEIDAVLTRAEKMESMQEWWETHHALLIEKGLTKEMLKKAALMKQLKLRGGIKKTFEFLNKNKVPIVIMSAGLGNVIELKLKSEGLLSDTVHVVSNTFTFDESGKANGKTGPIIHSMNKHETVLYKEKFYSSLEKRRNVLLLGDTLEDPGMVEGFDCDNLIKIGFMNKNFDKPELVKKYKAEYDIIITGDGPAEAVLDLIKELFE